MHRQYYLMVPGRDGYRFVTNHDASAFDVPERRLSFETAGAAVHAARALLARSTYNDVKILAEIAIVTAIGPRPVTVQTLEERKPTPDDGGPPPPEAVPEGGFGDIVA